MKKVLSFYGVFSLFLIIIYNVTAFISPTGGNDFNRYNTGFIVNTVLVNLALILQVVCTLFILKHKDGRDNKKRQKVDYNTLSVLAVCCVAMMLTGVIFNVISILPQAIGTVLVYAVLAYNGLILLKTYNKINKISDVFKSRIFLCAVVPLLCLIIVAAVLINLVFKNSLLYSRASKLLKNGDEKSAVLILKDLENYKDSAELIEKVTASKSGTDEQERFALYAAQVGDTVKFGKYEQDNNTDNGTEDLEWIVIGSYNKQLLLITKDCIDCIPYNEEYVDTTWENCTLRKWLNSDFLTSAFTDDERSMIIEKTLENPNTTYGKRSIAGGKNTTDNVFLLSLNEANIYLNEKSLALAKPSEYARSKGVYRNSDTGYCWWWLRSPGAAGTNAARANLNADLKESFSKMGYYVNYSNHGVRPCVWIDLEH